MPKAYWVVEFIVRFSDPQKVAAYAKLAPAATAAFGARYVARGNAVAAHEDGRKERVVITEFPSLEQATAAYDKPRLPGRAQGTRRRRSARRAHHRRHGMSGRPCSRRRRRRLPPARTL